MQQLPSNIFYELIPLEAAEEDFVETEERSRRVVKNLIHAPHSPSLRVRSWLPA
jgi:hypothetical protein